jgi:hypothetical protein
MKIIKISFESIENHYYPIQRTGMNLVSFVETIYKKFIQSYTIVFLESSIYSIVVIKQDLRIKI